MSRRGRPPHPDILTPREWEVLALLREGLSNPEIAARLAISRDGVKFHVSEILTKLGVASREEASAWSAAERRPWWAAALAPVALVWRKTGWALGGAVLVTAVAGLGLLAVLVWKSGGSEQAKASSHELAYLREDGAFVLYNADTNEQHVLVQNGTCGRSSRLEWSPTGTIVACLDPGGGANDTPSRIVFLDTVGTVVGQIDEPGLADLYWSPTGNALLYGAGVGFMGPRHYRIANAFGQQIADLGSWDQTGVVSPARASYGLALWSPDGNRVASRPAADGQIMIYSLDKNLESTIAGDYYPVGWALSGEALIVAANYRREVLGREEVVSYEANLLDLASGKLIREPALDNGVQFLLSPDGSHVVYLTRGQRSDGAPGLGVIDLRTGVAKPINHSIVRKDAHFEQVISNNAVSFSVDGAWVYWAGNDNNGYRARIDGSGLEKLVRVRENYDFAWSPDHRKIAYSFFLANDVAASNTLYVMDGDGSHRVVVDSGPAARGGFDYAAVWRPLTTP